MSQAVPALDTTDWLLLIMSVLMIGAGLVALVAPLHRLGMAERPWSVVFAMLPTGVLGAAVVAAQVVPAGAGVQTALLAAEILLLAVLILAALHVRRRARQRQASAAPGGLIGAGELAEARALAASGNRIAAIRRVRELTGLGLAEAKALVDRFGQNHSGMN